MIKDTDKFERRMEELSNTKEDENFVEILAREFDVTNKEVLEEMNLELYIRYLIANNFIPDIFKYHYIDKNFREEWLKKSGD